MPAKFDGINRGKDMRLLRIPLAALLLSVVALNASAKAEDISIKCTPDPSSYYLNGNPGARRGRMGPENMRRRFRFNVPSGSKSAYYIFPDGSIAEYGVKVTPLDIEVTIDKDNPPFITWKIARINGNYRQEVEWVGYTEEMFGSCSREEVPTDRKF